jgi:catecholate siderophore receptor
MPHRAFPAVAPLTAALALALALPAHAAEDEAAAPRRPRDLDKVQVVGKYEDKASSVKYTEPLRDTPQTITVVNREVMEEQNLLGLRDVLTTLPGITFGAGEGGGGYGDSITLRGYSASSDITTDNVRDSAQYSRTDSFNLEAIELVNGANSVYSGAGSVGGNINLVTKTARAGTFNTLQLGAGTDDYGRVTLDSNVDLGATAAFRINLMAHRNDAPGRDVEKFERWGIAPSIALGLGTDTRFTLSYFHQSDDNIPQYGVPYYSVFGGPLPGVDPSNYYGYANVDTQDIDVDMLTAVLEHDIGENTTLRTLARVQQVDQLSIVNPPQGTWCLGNGINASTFAACNVPGTFVPTQPTGPRGNFRDTTNGIAILQTDLTTRFDTGGIEHAVVAGLSLSEEDFDLDTGNVQRNADGSTPVLPPMDIANPYNLYNGPINYVRSNITKGGLSNQALYLFDTLKFDEKWMLNLGARWEHNEGDTVVDTYGTSGATLGQVTAHTDFDNEEDLFSYRAAVLFKPVEAGTIYLSYSDSKTPSKASVNGACTAQTCNVDPETAVNIELGTKWDLTDRLAVSAAVFRNDREAFKVADPGNPANPSGEQQLDGRARVEGVSLGVAGMLLPHWSVFANVTVLDSEVLQGVSDHVAATSGDLFAGRAIAGTPERSGSVWTTYDLERWSFGYGVTYQSGYDWYNASGANFGYIHGFTTHRAMVSFDVTRDLTLQLNANNLFDKQYYTRVRNNGWATPGDARSVVLSATYRF